MKTGIGKLNRRVELLRSTETGRQTSGEPILSWAVYATVWGQLEGLGGREFFAAQQVNDEVTVRIVIRYRSDVLSKDAVRLGGQDYDIVTPLNFKGQSRWLHLMCRTQRAEVMT